MKFGITSIFINATPEPNRANGLEVHYLKKALEDLGHEVDVIGKRTSKNAKYEFYKEYTEVKLESYDCIFLQNSFPVFFGGRYRGYSPVITHNLTKAKKICFICTDPLIPPLNAAKAMGRFDLNTEDIDAWERILEDGYYLFPGKSIEQFYGKSVKNLINWDFFTYMFKEKYSKPSVKSLFQEVLVKKWDVIYFGRKREGFRENMLKKYMPSDTNNILVGYKSDKIPGEYFESMKLDKLENIISGAKVSLIIGDKEHLDNVITFRLYETLASNTLAAISIEYDPNRELIKNEELKEILYVESSEDVKKLAEAYSPRLIELQKKELARIFSEFTEPLDLSFVKESELHTLK